MNSTYNIVAQSGESTVVAEYHAAYDPGPGTYQDEAALEHELLEQLQAQGYQYLPLHSEADLLANLRARLEALNNITFSDGEWQRFFLECLANSNESISEKTRKIQEDYIQILHRDDGSDKNIYLLDKTDIHNNTLQVINQYEQPGGAHPSRYDVTILVNGLPLVHVELKRRGVALKEAFNQIRRYQRESFWAASGLFEYVQIFVISNGTETKYYSNTTRLRASQQAASFGQGKSTTSNSFEFTSFWADAANHTLPDLKDFTRTFFARHTLLNILTRYCVFTSEQSLLVMRPYQIAATERLLQRLVSSSHARQMGSKAAGGYIWHTTGSGKTLTSFKAAQLASKLEGIDKVLFVVDRKDLDYQTMREYDRFEKGAANGNTSTRVLQRQLEDRDEHGNPHPYKILVTTIQKLDLFISRNKTHPIYNQHVVIIFDECHRSQFGAMHQAITRQFKKYHIFGFTGTPIFSDNATAAAGSPLRTTDQIFGERLHTYTIVDAINDGNVLPFLIDYVSTIKAKEDMPDEQVWAIDRERALADPERVRQIVAYTLEHFDQKTKRASSFLFNTRWLEADPQASGGKRERSEERRIWGFNAIFAADSIAMARGYYLEFKRQQAGKPNPLKIATIFSYSPNEEEAEGLLPDETFETAALDASSRDFLERAIADYNQLFKTNFDTSADKFQNYYKDLSQRVKNREVDLLIVVNMFLTGFDATALNTLWVDKNLRQHGLIQAFSRTNRILNSVKTFGNIVCFRDLSQKTDEAIALFGDKEASGIVLMKSFHDYYEGYSDSEGRHAGYRELIDTLTASYPLGQPITGEAAQKDFIKLYGAILKQSNILSAFDEFEGQQILSPRQFQDYQSLYLDLYDSLGPRETGERAIINEDITFELELIRQIEVNIDYILLLVAKYHASHCQDKAILVNIDKAVSSSLQLRSKKELIQNFINQISNTTNVGEDWPRFVREQKDQELEALIAEEQLKPEPTRTFINNAFRSGAVRTTGTDIDQILPPLRRFGGDNARALKKQTVIEKLQRFFEKYFGLA